MDPEKPQVTIEEIYNYQCKSFVQRKLFVTIWNSFFDKISNNIVTSAYDRTYLRQFMQNYSKRIFIIDFIRRFSVVTSCCNNMSHKWTGKFSSVLARPTIKWFLKVLIALLSALRLCMWGGTSWQFIFFSSIFFA